VEKRSEYWVGGQKDDGDLSYTFCDIVQFELY
jgi:hypothetical protein